MPKQLHSTQIQNGAIGSAKMSSTDLFQFKTKNPTLSGISNDSGTGEVVTFGGGTTVAGKLYYLATNGNWTLTDSDVLGSGETQILGLALGTNPAVNGMLIRGYFDVDTIFEGTFTTGIPVYVSGTTGKVTTTKPTTPGNFTRVAGYCTNTAKVIYFTPGTSSRNNIRIPRPKEYFDCSIAGAQIGNNAFASGATINSSEGRFDSKCLEFGSSGNVAPAALQYPIDVKNSWTFLLWFKSKRTGTDWGTMFKQGGGGSSNAYYVMYTNGDDELGYFTPGTDHSSGYDMTSLESSSDWHMIASVGSTSSNDTKFYVDGEYVGAASGVITDKQVQHIGSYSGTNQQVFAEFIDELAFWDQALTAAQIKEIYTRNQKIIDLV